MGHGIEKIRERHDGVDVDVDCFAFSGERAWHGLGQKVGERGDATVTLEHIEHAARADWGVVVDEVKTVADDQAIEGVQALVRDRDRKVLGCTTDRYAVIQHRELGVLLDALVKAGKGTWETCGVLSNGQRAFYAVRLRSKIAVRSNDETELFAIATTSHDGTATSNLILSGVRVCCQNTLSLALSKNIDSVAVRHTGGAAAALNRARDVVLDVDARVGQVAAAMEMLTGIELNEKQSQRFLDLVSPVPALPPAETFTRFGEEKQKRTLYAQDLASRVQSRIRELHETHVGQELARRGSGYAWLQASTAYSAEMRSKSKVESMMVGEAAKLGRRAFSVLTEPSTRDAILAAT